ncbi:MAG: hypothetical protein FAF03_02650 [Epsilonproteobacteria bacterium]|nr:hypothetical protein [Campylobacterota bacterium]
MKNIISYCIISVMFILNSCHKQDNILNDKAVQFCLDNNGTVVQSVDNAETLCQYLSNYTYDDGEENYNTNCEINTFYNNPDMCNNLEEEGINTSQPLVYTPDDSDSMSIRTVFYTQVKDILEHLNNTGYTHRNDGPFILHPGYAELTPNNLILKKFNSYNLFLDCSGFVGYYVVQGIAKELYHKINTCYHSSRPLAADFADTFMSSQYKTTDKNISEATLSDLDTNSSAILWGRVPNIKNAKPGDIIVYKHVKNITHHGRCNNTVHGNTGHVLFIMEKSSIKK